MLSTESTSSTRDGVVVPTRTLAEILIAWRRTMKDAAIGPQQIAAEVVALGDRWPEYAAQAGGKSFHHWVASSFRNCGESYFRRVHAAVLTVGKQGASEMCTEGVVRVASKSEAIRTAVLAQVHLSFRGKRPRSIAGAPLTLHQVANIIREVAGAGRPPGGGLRELKAKLEASQAHVQRLKAQLIHHGLSPVD